MSGSEHETTPLRRFTARSAAFISSVNLGAQGLDRLLSFAQIIVVAALLGATSSADLYFLASIVPLTLGTVVGEPVGRLLLTLLVREEERGRERALLAAGFFLVAAGFLVVTAVYDAAAVVLVHAVTPMGSGSVLPWLAFSAIGPALGLSAYLSGALLWLERYTIAALRVPVASLAGLVFMLVVATQTHDVGWIAVAAALGYVAAALWLFVDVCRSLGASWLLCADRVALTSIRGVWRRLVGPIVGGAMGGQVIIIVERLLASRLGPGAVATLSYARGIAGAPNALAAAVGAGIYPGLVRADAAGSDAYLRQSFLLGLRLSLYSGIVFGCVFGLFGRDVVAFALQRGAFDLPDVNRAGTVLVILALSTVTGALVMYLLLVFYGIDRFEAILRLEGSIFGAYIVLALVLRAALNLDGLALAFPIAQIGGIVYALVHAARRLQLRTRVIANAVWPVVVRAAVVCATLGVIRVTADHEPPPVAWRGAVRACVPVAVACILGAGLLAVGDASDARRVRSLIRRRGG